MSSKKRVLPSAPVVDSVDSAAAPPVEVVGQCDDLVVNTDRHVVHQTVLSCAALPRRRSLVGGDVDETQRSEDSQASSPPPSSTSVTTAARTSPRRRVRDAGRQRSTIWNAIEQHEATWRSTATSTAARVTASASSAHAGVTSSQQAASNNVQTSAVVSTGSRRRPQTADATARRHAVTGRRVTGDQTWQVNGDVSGRSSRTHGGTGAGATTTSDSAATSSATWQRCTGPQLMPQSRSRDVTRSTLTTRSCDKLADTASCSGTQADDVQATNIAPVSSRFVTSSLDVMTSRENDVTSFSGVSSVDGNQVACHWSSLTAVTHSLSGFF